MPEKHPPKAVVDYTEELEKDPWKLLKERPGVKVLSVARRIPREL